MQIIFFPFGMIYYSVQLFNFNNSIRVIIALHNLLVYFFAVYDFLFLWFFFVIFVVVFFFILFRNILFHSNFEDQRFFLKLRHYPGSTFVVRPNSMTYQPIFFWDKWFFPSFFGKIYSSQSKFVAKKSKFVPKTLLWIWNFF